MSNISLPDVTVIGTLTADPELRFTPSGAAVANFTIASNSRKLNKQTQEWEDGDATFLRCNIWRQYAENVAESLVRGDKVIAHGQLKQRQFETREGEKRTVFELEVDAIGPALQFATAKVTRANRSGGQQYATAAASAATAPAGDSWGSGDDEPGW